MATKQADEAPRFRLPARYRSRFYAEFNRAEERLFKGGRDGWTAGMPTPQAILDKVIADEKKEQEKHGKR